MLISCSHEKKNVNFSFDSSSFKTKDSLSKINYLDSLLKYSDYESSLYFKIAEEYYDLNNLNRANQVSQIILRKSRNENDSLSIGRAYYYIGDCYEYTYKDSAYYFYKQAEKIFTATKNYDRLAKTHFNKGYLLFYDGVYTESEIELTKALYYLKNSDNYLLQFQCLSLQGGNLEALSLYDEALEYYNEAKNVLVKLKVDNDKLFYYDVINKIDISNIYASQKKYQLSLDVISNIDLLRLKQYKPIVYAKIITNIAYNKLNLYGAKTEIKDLLDDSLYLVSKYGNNNDYVYVYQYFGEYYLKLGLNSLATENLKKGLDVALMSNYSIDVLNILKLLSQSDPENFDTYHNDYMDRYQDLLDRQIKIKNKFARIEYDTRRIQDLNKSLSAKIQYGIYIVIIVILLIIMFALWRIYISNRIALNFALLKNEAEENLYALLQEQQRLIDKAQTEEKKRIAIELHDGIMNKLYSTRLNLGILNKSNDIDSINSRKVLIKDLQNIESEIRDLSHNLNNHEAALVNNYEKLILNLVASQNNISNTTFSISVSEKDKLASLQPIIKFNIYRIIQESLLNIQKHAQAQNAIISLDFNEDMCFLTIHDDGVGFQTTKKAGIGISNIKHRVKLLKGKLEINSIPGKGVTIKIDFPIHEN